jgi:hypothetical protein
MTLYLNDGDSVVQILACGQDPQRLCDEISTHVAADRAKHASVYEARVSIDQTRLMAPNAAVPQSPEHTPTKSPTKLPSFYLGQTNLTLTLLHMDTTFRFNSVSASSCSPGLAWPTIHRSFASSPFVDDDLVLRAQYHHPNTSLMRRKRPDTPSHPTPLTLPRYSARFTPLARRDIRQLSSRRRPVPTVQGFQSHALLLDQTTSIFAGPSPASQGFRRCL